MPCNKDAFKYLDKCGVSGTNFRYINNGGGVKDPFEKKPNHVYTPYVLFSLGETVFATTDFAPKEVQNNNSVYKVNATTFIQSFEMTIGTSFEGNITLMTCNYEDVEKLISIVPKENCEFDKFFFGGSGNDALATAYIDIGWIIRGCNDSTEKYGMEQATSQNFNTYKILFSDEQQRSGPYIYGLAQSVNVTTDGGAYKVTLKFIDGFQKTEQNRLDNIIFNENHKGRLLEAVKKFAKFNCKNRKEDSKQDVALIRTGNPNESITEWKFLPSDGGDKGVFSYFNPNRLSLFEYYRELLNVFRTERKKGFSFAYDNGSKGKPMVLILEDRNANFCVGENGAIDFNNIPTYIVNGGDCSPVVKFNTQFQATPLKRSTNESKEQAIDLGIGGGNPSAMGQKPVEIFDCIRNKNTVNGQLNQPKIEPTSNAANGVRTAISPNSFDATHTPPNQIAQKKTDGMIANIKAGLDTDNLPIIGLIKADLEIHGDPFWANTINWLKNQYVKIVFINPYCVKLNTSECSLLAESTCNPYLSGIYQIKSCRHTINSGSYVTSLELYNIGFQVSSTRR
jgi:hypothetical protein